MPHSSSRRCDLERPSLASPAARRTVRFARGRALALCCSFTLLHPSVRAQTTAEVPPADAAPGALTAEAEREAAVSADAAHSVLDIAESLAKGDVVIGVEDVVSSARETSSDIRAASASQRAAEASADAETVTLYPQLHLSASYRRLSPVDAPPLRRNAELQARAVARQAAGISQPPDPLSAVRFPSVADVYLARAELVVPISQALLAGLPRVSAARERAAAQQRYSRTVRQDVELSAHESFYEYARARAQHLVLQASHVDAMRRRDEALLQIRAGVLGRAAELTANRQLMHIGVELERSGAAEAAARARLSQIMGRPLPQTIGIREVLLREGAPLGALQQLLAHAQRTRPEIHSLAHTIEALDAEHSAASASVLPSVSVVAGTEVQNPKPRVFPQQDRFGAAWDIGVLLEWSLSSALESSQRGDAFRAATEQARAQLQSLREAIAFDVTTAFADCRALGKVLGIAQKQLAVAEEDYEVHMLLFRSGKIPSRELQSAEDELRTARLELVDAAVDLRIAEARLKRAVGDML